VARSVSGAGSFGGISVVSIETASVAIGTDPESSPLPVDPVDSVESAGLQRSVHDGVIRGNDGQTIAVKLSIMMAAYNEELTIERAVRGILQVQYPCEIELIVVDDGSTDRTLHILKEIDDPRFILHSHDMNQGKGASILTAASLATGTHIVPFDADLEYSPEDLVNLLDPVMKGRYDVVYGVRLFGCNTVYQSYRYAIGNRVLTHFTNILYNSYLNDLHTCLKLMPLSFFRNLGLTETGFGLDTQVTALLLRTGVRPFEVPISYFSRSHEQGKKINWRDAVRCVWILIRSRVRAPKRDRSQYAIESTASQRY
jgi:glycosyltransferase involved in cell wall biosynthesis